VAGCDSGFGNMLAKRLIENDFTVFAGCLDPNGEGAKKLKESARPDLHILHLDVTNDQHLAKAKDFVYKHLAGKRRSTSKSFSIVASSFSVS
jgi:3-hydroxybutyrate dehydrogenase